MIKIKGIINKLKELQVKRVFLQYGNGLKLRIQGIAKQLEKEGFETIICAESTFGACDLRDEEAMRLGCDAILHIGHEQFVPKAKIPVVYWEYFLQSNPTPILDKEFAKLKDFASIGLITSIQFVQSLQKIKEYLERRGKKVFVHKTLQYPGQILGCRLEAAKAIEKKVDCFLCVSAGKFYGLGIVLLTDKPVLCLDLEKGEIYELEDFKKKTQKLIAWNKAQFKDAKRVGILVSWKRGQAKDPFELKKSLEKEGKEVYVLAMDEITPEKIEGLKLDFLINCACPRIGIDDIQKYKLPLINVAELKEQI